jgi:hypothetical protein
MLKTNLPVESGWFWLRDVGLSGTGWTMAHLAYSDDDSIRLWVCCSERTSDGDFYDRANAGPKPQSFYFRFDDDRELFIEESGSRRLSPTQWIGPISNPGSPHQSLTLEHSEELHSHAEQHGMAIVTLHFDRTHCAESGHWGS